MAGKLSCSLEARRFLRGSCSAMLSNRAPKDAAPAALLAGVSRADITPPIGLAQLNWGSQTHVEAVGVDPVGMYATALVLANGTQKFALVDIGALFVPGGDIAARASCSDPVKGLRVREGQSRTHRDAAAGDQGNPAASMYFTDEIRHVEEFRTYMEIICCLLQQNTITTAGNRARRHATCQVRGVESGVRAESKPEKTPSVESTGVQIVLR